MENNSFYTKIELSKIGFLSFGENVQISKKCSIYSPDKIKIADNVRIDDFCILSGKITVGSYVHIAANTSIYGGDAGVFIEDFVNISGRVSIYSISDDYSGNYLTSPLIDEKFKNTISLPVTIKKYSIIGTTSVILPGVTIEEGSAFGAMSLIKNSTEPWTIYTGIPIKKLKKRSKNILNLINQFNEQ